jgi:hypothetical protein
MLHTHALGCTPRTQQQDAAFAHLHIRSHAAAADTSCIAARPIALTLCTPTC